MRSKLLLALTVAAGMLAVCKPALAHHGTSFYDLTKSITSKATMTGMHWENPHCVLEFETKDDKGVVTHWAVETYSPLYLTRAGWTKDTLKPGDEITITFHPAKNGTGIGYIRDGDGKIILKGKNLSLVEL
ncbi:MAG TPA: DUF6152 family protein [Terriglobales bacterium]|nr:DUF6152 family protein [Terriglobales bacterium]